MDKIAILYKKWEVPSKTVPNKKYIVRIYKGKILCSCPKFIFTRKCKHLENLPS
jgi:hypothetical protein